MALEILQFDLHMSLSFELLGLSFASTNITSWVDRAGVGGGVEAIYLYLHKIFFMYGKPPKLLL